MRTTLLIAATAAALIASCTATAQRLSWRLPERGLAIYDQTDKSKLRVIESPKTPVPTAIHPFGDRHVAILLDSELDSKRTHMVRTPLRLDAVAPWIALDLRSAARPGTVKVRLRSVEPFGDLVITGRAEPVGDDGEQKLALRIAREPIARGHESESDFIHWRDHMFDWELSGELEITRRIDRERGLVTSFDSAIDAVYKDAADPARPATQMHYEQRWQLREVLDHRYAGFQSRVDEAIGRGRAWIREQIADPRARPVDVDPERSRGAGRLALALLTLLKTEVPADDPVVEQGFAELRKRDIRETYSLATAIMAVEALYTPPGERQRLLDGQQERPTERRLSETDRQLVRDWTKQLLANRDTSVDTGYLSRWNYTPGPRFDNSNTQYALLGLYSAHLCGVEVNQGVWVTAAEHLLQNQNDAEGKPRSLTLTSYAEAKKLLQMTPRQRQRRTIGAGQKAAARGWGYWGDKDQLPYGSMVAAGVSGLSICAAGMRDAEMRGQFLAKVDRGIRDGLAWLRDHRALRHNAGDNTWLRGSHYFYYLYSLERAFELSRIAWVDDWDWYFDGASLLLEKQNQRGTFGAGGLVKNCFCVLFLKKAQLPVLTKPR